MVKSKYSNLLHTNNANLDKLHQIVVKAVEEEQLLSKKLESNTFNTKLTIGEKLSDKVATFGGSWKFIIIFAGSTGSSPMIVRDTAAATTTATTIPPSAFIEKLSRSSSNTNISADNGALNAAAIPAKR